MSNELAKYLNSRRRQKDENAVAKQMKIAKANGMTVKQPHRTAKHHATNCGNSNCVMCGNPRKTFKELTIQEQRMFQDTERQDTGVDPNEDTAT